MTQAIRNIEYSDANLRLLPTGEEERTFHDIGRQLKEYREKRKLSVDQVSKGLKIRGAYIQAIEDGMFQSLPGNVYVGGYLKNYADYVGADGEQLLASFRSAGGHGRDDDNYMLPELTHDEMKPGKMSLLIAAVILFVLYGVWHVFERRSDIKPYTEHTATELPADVKSAAALQARIVLLAKGDVEINIMGTGGELLQQKLMHSGETYFVPKEALLLKTDTPAHLEMFVDGERVAPVGPAVVSEAGILLDANKLLETSGMSAQ